MRPRPAAPATHLARAVHQEKLPAAIEDFEYFAEMETAEGQALRWPATAPELNHTVVITE